MTLHRSLVVATFALIVGSAIAVDPGGWASFVTLRWAAMSTAAMALAALTAWHGELRLHRRSAAGWAVFLAWAALAGIGALDPLYTWIGTPDRHLGFIALVLFALMYFAGQTFRGREAALVLLRAAVLALLVIGVYTIFEVLGRPLISVELGGRPGGPYGTAAYLGAACSLLLPISVGAAIDGLDGPFWRNLAFVASGVGAIAALAAQTRAGWVGIVAAALIAAPATIDWVKRRWPVCAAAAIALLIVAVVSPIGARTLAAIDFSDGTARGRVDEWQVGARVAVNHPVLGVGLEGYRIAFAEGVDANYEMRYTRITQPDRAHNGALDVAVTTGLPGMALYLAMAGFLVWRSIAAVRTKDPWLVGIAAGVAGYLAQQWFLFPITEVDPVFWLFAGALVADSLPAIQIPLRRVKWTALPIALLAVGAAVFGVLDVAADRQAASALRSSSLPSAALDHADTAISLRPDSIRYRFVAATIAAPRKAIGHIEDALELSPQDPILRRTEASLHLQLAVDEQNADELQIAIDLWTDLVNYDQVHAESRFQLGNAFALAGNNEAAAAQLNAAATLAPGSTAALVNLAKVYADSGLDAAGFAVVKLISEIDPSHPQLEQLRGLFEP